MDISLIISNHNLLRHKYDSTTSNSPASLLWKPTLYSITYVSSIFCYYIQFYKEGPCAYLCHVHQCFCWVDSWPGKHLDVGCAHEPQKISSTGSPNNCPNRHPHQWTHKLPSTLIATLQVLKISEYSIKIFKGRFIQTPYEKTEGVGAWMW